MLLGMIQWLHTVTSWWCNKKDNLVCFICLYWNGGRVDVPITWNDVPSLSPAKLMAGKQITVRYILKTWYSQPSINNRSFLICEQYFERNIPRSELIPCIVSNLLVPNPTNKIHHNLSRKRIDISCWPWWGITIPSGGFFAQRLAAQVLGFQGSPCPLDHPPRQNGPLPVVINGVMGCYGAPMSL